MSDRPQSTPGKRAQLAVPRKLALACNRRAAELEIPLDELNRRALWLYLELSLSDEAGWTVRLDHDEHPDVRRIMLGINDAREQLGRTSASADDPSLAQAYIEETAKLQQSPAEEKEGSNG